MIDERELIDVRICALQGCDEELAPDAHPFAKYCPTHAPPKKTRPQPRSKSRPTSRPRRDAPPKIVIDLGKANAKPSAAKAKIAEKATQWTVVAGMVVYNTGDQTCGQAVVKAAPGLGKAMADLAEYQPWIDKLFSGSAGGSTGAWVGLIVAASPIIITVLAHHNLLPESIAAMLGGALVAPAPAPSAPSD